MGTLDGSKRQQQVLELAEQGLTVDEVAERLQLSHHTVLKYRERAAAVNKPLSIREKQVAELVVRGLSTAAIAGELRISDRTVETHRYSIARKLRAPTHGHLVAKLAEGVIGKVKSRSATLEEFIARQERELEQLREKIFSGDASPMNGPGDSSLPTINSATTST